MSFGSALKSLFFGSKPETSQTPQSISKFSAIGQSGQTHSIDQSGASKFQKIANPESPVSENNSGASKFQKLAHPEVNIIDMSGASKFRKLAKPDTPEQTPGQISGVSKIRVQSAIANVVDKQPNVEPAFRTLAEDKSAWSSSRLLAKHLKQNPTDEIARKALFRLGQSHSEQADLASARNQPHIADANRKYAEACSLTVDGRHEEAGKAFENAKLKEAALKNIESNPETGNGPKIPENDGPEQK